MSTYIEISDLEDLLLALDYEDLFDLCDRHPDITQICADEDFWRRKSELDFNITQKPKNMSWAKLYHSEYFKSKNSRQSADGLNSVLSQPGLMNLIRATPLGNIASSLLGLQPPIYPQQPYYPQQQSYYPQQQSYYPQQQSY